MYTLNCKGRLLVIGEPIVMGIINVTPDSFYDQSRYGTVEAALLEAGRMIHEGATIIDIGGQSTRPGSASVSVEEEIQRVVPVIKAISSAFPDTFLSIDSYSAEVAEAAVDAGASIVNDVSAGSFDDKMIPSIAKLGVPYVLMHMKGNPQTMNNLAQYADVITDVLDFLIQKIQLLRSVGIVDIVADPGIGFAKTATHNFQLINNLTAFQMLDVPVLLGLSRKSFISKSLNVSPAESLNGTTVLNTMALLNGANILRVHDVKAAVEAMKLVKLVRSLP